LRPGKARRAEVLAGLPEEQRPIAELALQGMPAVRQRLKDDNERLIAEGKPPMPEASVLKLAEELLPRLRVAEWLDRAEASIRQIEHLDLRDLRSVVAASEDPIVARDETARAVATELRAALVTKQEQELQLWFEDIETALGVGRVIRALRLSSQPPKAGVPFPTDLAQRLAASAAASLTSADLPDRWCAVLEAAAFSPVRSLIVPQSSPEQVTDELRATVTRLAPALPQIAALFGVEVPAKAPMPKPLRPTPRTKPAGGAAKPAKAAPASRDRASRAAEESEAAAAPETAEKPAAPATSEATEAPTTTEASEAVSHEEAAAPSVVDEPSDDAPSGEPNVAEESVADDSQSSEPTTES
jgi:hypothetical protein